MIVAIHSISSMHFKFSLMLDGIRYSLSCRRTFLTFPFLLYKFYALKIFVRALQSPAFIHLCIAYPMKSNNFNESCFLDMLIVTKWSRISTLSPLFFAIKLNIKQHKVIFLCSFSMPLVILLYGLYLI